MNLTKRGLELIKKHEGLSLTPYLCPAGVPTIGYGNTFYKDGSKVSLNDAPITEKQSEELLKTIVERFESAVNIYTQKPLTQNQFNALVSFTYNVGIGAFKNSTLLKKVNDNPNNCKEIFKQFLRWNKANGKVLRGLTKRREEEANLYCNE